MARTLGHQEPHKVYWQDLLMTSPRIDCLSRVTGSLPAARHGLRAAYVAGVRKIHQCNYVCLCFSWTWVFKAYGEKTSIIAMKSTIVYVFVFQAHIAGLRIQLTQKPWESFNALGDIVLFWSPNLKFVLILGTSCNRRKTRHFWGRRGGLTNW